MLHPKLMIATLRETAVAWYEDDSPRLAAALAYYTLLSTAPLVLLCIAIAGFAYGEASARGQIAQQISAVVGQQAGAAIASIASNAHQSTAGPWSSVVGAVVLVFGASGVFGELQTSLNAMWGVKPKPGRGVKGFIHDRFFSFTMVVGVAFLLLVSLVVSTLLAALGRFFEHSLPGGEAVWQVLNFAISLGVVALLFALLFKVVPDAKVTWKDVWLGGVFTALLFTIGKLLLGLYLGKSSFTSSYGAAGSLIALVVWVYYSAQILFLGAEFTKVYARHTGSKIKPDANAVPVPPPNAAIGPARST